MSDKSDLGQFWQELKRRKVFRVITVYAAAAWVILEFISNIEEPFGLPDWTTRLVFVILCVGLIISIILSWIYDITPEGIEKTKSVEEATKDEKIATPNSWKIATYTSVVFILGLLAFNIFGNRGQEGIDESLKKSIAVLPFKNFSTDPDQEYMCDGLTDEIINHLYKIESFDKVASLTSVLTYKETDKRIPQIAEELNVNYILEGTYKKIGEQLKVSAQLIEPDIDRHIWQNEYDRPFKEIIDIQADIAVQIAEQLKAYMTESERRIIQNKHIPDTEAYRLLQKAKTLYRSGLGGESKEDIEMAIQATKVDPEYADAYAWAGLMIFSRGLIWWEGRMQSVVWDALYYYEKALELDQNNAAAHAGMGSLNTWQKWNYIEAEKEFFKAIELAPNFLEIYEGCAEIFSYLRQFKVARNYIKKAQEIDDKITWYYPQSEINVFSGDRKETEKDIKAWLESLNGNTSIGLGRVYVWLEEYDSAIVHLESAKIPRDKAFLAIAYNKTGNYQKAEAIKEELIDLSRETIARSPAFFTGLYYSAIGEVDSAFYWLEKAYKDRSPEFLAIKADPTFNNLKEDERYWDLYERTGHKAYDDYIANRNK
jgi:TolB-like protein